MEIKLEAFDQKETMYNQTRCAKTFFKTKILQRYNESVQTST